MSEPEVVLRVTDLTRRFGDFLAVDHLSFNVHRGEIFGFLGPNGAGKTTSMKMMCGLLAPSGGQVELLGRPLNFADRHNRREIGLAPQELVIWGSLTCEEQLEFAACLYGEKSGPAKKRAKELLASFGLSEKAKALAKTLSGGMKRRLNIALGLAHNPKVLFLDEPQAGLDPQSRILVRDLIRSMKGQLTVVLTTHDMEEAEKLADRVCIIDHGNLLALDSVNGVKRQAGEGDCFEIELEQTPPTSLKNAVQSILMACERLELNDRLLVIRTSRGTTLLPQVLRMLQESTTAVIGLRLRKATLEDVFIRLTGRGLRQ